jgi:hypothetical protein
MGSGVEDRHDYDVFDAVGMHYSVTIAVDSIFVSRVISL